MTKESMDVLHEMVELMHKYPTLPVIPMVWGDIVLDQNMWWEGSWEDVKVTRFYQGAEGIYFYDEDDIDGCVNDSSVVWDSDDLDDDEALKLYRSLPWTDCIAVFIGMPEEH